MPDEDLLPPRRLPVPAPRAGTSAALDPLRRLFHRTAPAETPAIQRTPAAGLYVDIENLPGAIHAQRLIDTVLREWPTDRPPVQSLCLYSPAEKAALWHAWCTHRLQGARVRVRGVQRFTRESSKNAADVALAADAAADFATGAVQFVAVLSNDSDFASLYVKIDELAGRHGRPLQHPFLWITPTDGSPVSAEISAFFPCELRWILPSVQKATPPAPPPGNDPTPADIAAVLLEAFPANKQHFRASDARPVVAKRWPKHPAIGNPSTFGTYLANEVYPALAKRGVTTVSTKSPRTYALPR